MTDPKLEKPRHVKYWLRCLKTFLPHQYTSNDSNRMYLGYFILSALDLLDALNSNTSLEERQGYINWIYRCQHPQGGFRMWPGTDFGERATPESIHWDPANVPGTYFALASLLILGDDLQRVKRREALTWIRRMQRPDGSFGETFVHGKVEGGRDPRAGFCVAGIRHILQGPLRQKSTSDTASADIDIDAFVACVRAAESYDGGIADEAFHEPHAGYTFCSLGAMALLDRLAINNSNSSPSPNSTPTAPQNPQAVIHWLASRQTHLIDPDSHLDSEFPLPISTDSHPSSTLPPPPPSTQNLHQPASQTILSSPEQFPSHPTPSFPQPFSDSSCATAAGVNGRTGKIADTCYAFWVGASLHILHQPNLLHKPALQKFLLEETQHPVLGGFGKFPGDLPDLYHSYMGLAALSLLDDNEKNVKELDAAMCISKEVRRRLPAIWAKWSA